MFGRRPTRTGGAREGDPPWPCRASWASPREGTDTGGDDRHHAAHPCGRGRRSADRSAGRQGQPVDDDSAGWTPIIAGFNGCVCASDPGIGIGCQLSAWWKFATAGDSTVTFTFGPEVVKQAAGGVLRYSGADAANPIGPFACDNGTSAAPTAPSVTTTSADNRVVRAVVSDADQAKALFSAEPATKRFELASTTVFGPGSSYTTEAVVAAASDAPQAAAGATGTAAWSLPSAEQWAAMTVAVQPAAGGAEPSGCLAVVEWLRRKLGGGRQARG